MSVFFLLPFFVAVPSAQAVGQSSGQQRQILCHAGTAGTGQRPDVAGQSHECTKPALAKEKCRQEGRSGDGGARPGGFAAFAGAGGNAISRATLCWTTN